MPDSYGLTVISANEFSGTDERLCNAFYCAPPRFLFESSGRDLLGLLLLCGKCRVRLPELVDTGPAGSGRGDRSSHAPSIRESFEKLLLPRPC